MLLLYLKSYSITKRQGTEVRNRIKVRPVTKDSRILLVGMLDSPHFQKWLKIVQQEFPARVLLVFPSDRPRLFTSNFRDNKDNFFTNTKVFRLFPNGKLNFILYYLLDLVFGTKWRSYFLARFIIKHDPDILHFHEMQHGAYLYNSIANYRKIPQNSRKIVSTWGSDLTLYSWVDEHMVQISACFNWVDILTTEKKNELQDAKRLGFKSKFISPVYISLGQSQLNDSKIIEPSNRRLILIKGHQSDTGRSLNVLHVISSLGSQLKNFEIIVYSASISTQIQVDLLRNKHKINIKVLSKVTNDQMCKIFEQARISISLAVSDGLPGVLVEAMTAGAFPIQSRNSAGSEFLLSGKSGFLVDPWDLNGIKRAIIRALKSDELVNSAAVINRKVLRKKYMLNQNKHTLKQLYL
jgi:glycosyltransferase involved in cell wall biosynthesis